jgi:hypothetical protein
MNFHLRFQSFTNCLRRFTTLAICEILKTRVKLNLNFTRPHAITNYRGDANVRCMGKYQDFGHLWDIITNC